MPGTQSVPPQGPQDILHIKSLDQGPSQMVWLVCGGWGGGMLSSASPWLLAPLPPFPEWAAEQLLGPVMLTVPALSLPKGYRSQHFEGALCLLSTPPSFVYDY